VTRFESEGGAEIKDILSGAAERMERASQAVLLSLLRRSLCGFFNTQLHDTLTRTPFLLKRAPKSIKLEDIDADLGLHKVQNDLMVY